MAMPYESKLGTAPVSLKLDGDTKKTAVITCQSTPAAQIGRSAAVSLPRPEKCGLPRSRKAAWHGMAWPHGVHW